VNTNEIGDYYINYVKPNLAPIAAATFLTFLFSLCYLWISRRVGKRDTFRETIGPILSDVETVDGKRIESVYRASVETVRDACAKFQWYVLPWNRCAFHATCRKYCNLQKDKDAFIPTFMPVKKYPEDLTAILSRDYEPHRQLVAGLLKRLLALA
jgi:hypothetical protein